MANAKVEVHKIRNWNAGEDVEKLLGPIIRRHLNLLLKELRNDADVYVSERKFGPELVVALGEEACVVIRLPFKQIDAIRKIYEEEGEYI